MSDQPGHWRDTKGNRNGELVRLVLRNGVHYKQFKKNNRVGPLISLDADSKSEPEDSSEDEVAPDSRAPRTNPLSQGQSIPNRHGSTAQVIAAQTTQTLNTTSNRHYALNSDSSGRIGPPRDAPYDIDLTARPEQLRQQVNEARRNESPDRHATRLASSANAQPFYPQHSTASVATFVSSLLNFTHDFVEIRRADYQASRIFVLQNPTIVHEDRRQELLHDAARAIRAGVTQHAESCVEKAVLINECLGLTAGGRRSYLDDLVRSPQSQEDLKRECSQTLAVVTQRATRQPSAPAAPVPSAVVPAAVPRHGYVSRGGTAKVYPAGPRDHRVNVSDPLASLSSFGDLSVSKTDRHGVAQPPAPRRNNTGAQPVLHQDSGRHNVDLPSTMINVNDQPRPRGQLYTLPSADGDYDFKGTDGEEEKLDPRYKKRSDAKTFFSEGRVFAMLWHENASPDAKPGDDVKFITTKGRYGSQIFTHIRRMVVVRQREGYCCCLGINSYGGNGISKKGLKPAEQQAHAIIHMSTAKPISLPNEVVMTKEPIAVDMAPGQVLNSKSRLHYGAPNTVQWNVKVMNVGKVHKDSRAFLMSSWRNEMGWD